jgi:hypothetical protein
MSLFDEIADPVSIAPNNFQTSDLYNGLWMNHFIYGYLESVAASGCIYIFSFHLLAMNKFCFYSMHDVMAKSDENFRS